MAKQTVTVDQLLGMSVEEAYDTLDELVDVDPIELREVAFGLLRRIRGEMADPNQPGIRRHTSQ